MEEVDNIIIDSLKHINCSIDDDITSLKQFDNDLFIKAIMSCIDSISPDTELPHSLPISMSQRLKLATNISEHIKQLGFRGDIGYQTILYCNEVEARRLLMFLIERLPREPDKTLPSDDSGRQSSVVKEIKKNLHAALKSVWLPSELLKNGVRQTQNCTIKLGYGSCYPLQSTKLHIPNTSQDYSEEPKQYSYYHLPDVTKQCTYNKLIPSLLFTDFSKETKITTLKHFVEKRENNVDNWNELSTEVKLTETEQQKMKQVIIEDGNASIEEKPKVVDKLIEEVKVGKEKVTTLQNELKILESQNAKILDTKVMKQKELDTSLQQLNIKSKSQTLLSNSENTVKLKLVIDTGNKKLIDLTSQWHDVQKPLVKRYRVLLENSKMNVSEVQNLQERLQKVKVKSQKAQEEFKEKSQLQTQLTEQCGKLSKQTNRSAYTRRILEIISNIKKQSTDIEKILEDTRLVQKEINTLNGQLERSFALSDEVIFRDAKHEDTARKAYKLLASMHSEYEQVIQAATELGSIIRETRNLQEQVDTEETREINIRLERVMSDLNQVRNETASLLKECNK